MLQLINAILRVLCPADVQAIESDPVMYEVFTNGNVECSGGAFYCLYTRNRDIVERTPLLREPAFLVQLDELLTKQYGQQAPNVWTLSGVQKHTVINGQMRSLKEWRK